MFEEPQGTPFFNVRFSLEQDLGLSVAISAVFDVDFDKKEKFLSQLIERNLCEQPTIRLSRRLSKFQLQAKRTSCFVKRLERDRVPF